MNMRLEEGTIPHLPPCLLIKKYNVMVVQTSKREYNMSQRCEKKGPEADYVK